jgi:glycosyltransferase involved in cell wall biosynthesis
MRVAVAHPFFWPEVRRGAERFAHELARGLGERGHDVRLVTSHRASRSEDVVDGVEVVRLRRAPGSLTQIGVPHPVGHLPALVAELRSERPDVVVALMPLDALAATAAGLPTVYPYMGIPSARVFDNRPALARLLRLTTRRVAATTALSHAASDAFAELLGVAAPVIPAPVDVEAFTPDPARRASAPTLVCAGAPDEPRKRIRLLTQAFALLREELPDARLLLDRPRAPRLAGLLEAMEGVELRSFDDREALAGAYREAWASVLPSTGEAFGLVLAEALACGTPGVAHDSGGMPEVLRDGERTLGATFTGDAPRALADALRAVTNGPPDEALGRACRARAEAFSRARVAEAYDALLRDVTR